ncbi:protein javelin [Colias croceus]|uniref:protein javelin n=1 Tax=Colias crocea TaxID=72248 RepID=UPI001E279DD7|nr:protein javelin [Colias croceus]
MGAGHSADGDAGAYASDPPASERKKGHSRRRRHSVDSVASYSSQNHVDRIRTQNFSAASCQDDSDFGSIKTSLFRRSSSNLEYPAKRPDSVTSNTSSTRSRLREFVERKSSQDEHRSGANPVVDIQYFENPAETLEFDSPRNSLDSRKNQDERPKKRKLSKTKEPNDTKNKKQEKYQSKLADYYKLPVQLPQDEFYQHLTRSRAAEEFLQKRFSNSETEFSGSYGRLCKHRDIEGSNLRRSRSLAVIREETFTDLQIQNHGKNKRSQLIPRARLFDKPCFKDRLTGRTKYQTKEEVLEGIYIDSTVSCFADINRQGQEESNPAPVTSDNNSAKEGSVCNESQHSKSANGSWANLTEETKQINLSEDSIGHSRNPSEIDSLDSNYVRKHYNFEAHLKNCKEGSPSTGRSLASPSCKDLYIATDEHDSENECRLKSKTPNSACKERGPSAQSQRNNYNEIDSCHVDDHVTYDKISIQSKEIDVKDNQTDLYGNCNEIKDNGDSQSIISENDGTISSPPDSITSYISISIASSTEKSHKLEYLAHSLAEKIDEYCDSQNRESNQISTKSPVLNSENQPDKEPIYTSVQKKKTFADLRRESFARKQNSYQENINNGHADTYVSRTYIDTETYDKRNTCASKNITTEPFVTTLIENQYYSLPDINISKCLRKSERIDAQLREEDPEDNPCENTYEVAQTHFREILCNKSNENYGQLNKSLINITSDHKLSHNTSIYLPEYSEPQSLQNCTKLEDDLKSIITIESSNADDHAKEFLLDNHQNEREINEIEGTIRNTKLVTKSESLAVNSDSINRQEYKILKSFSNDNIPKSVTGKAKTNIKKHYSLRQRDPVDSVPIPSPDTVIRGLRNKDTSRVFSNPSFAEEIKNHCLLSRVKSFKSSQHSKIDIVPLSGHQTLVIDPPLNQSTDKPRPTKHLEEEFTTCSKNNNDKVISSYEETPDTIKPCETQTKETNSSETKESFFTIKLNKVVKTNLQKLHANTCDHIDLNTQQVINKPPSKLIIKDHKNYSLTRQFDTTNSKMTRPQILQVVDSKSKKYNNTLEKSKPCEKLETNNNKGEDNQDSNDLSRVPKMENCQVKDKLDDAIKTDIEYQVKINSVKNYWSQLIDKSPDHLNKQEKEESDLPNQLNQGEDNEVEKKISKPLSKDNTSFIPEVSVGKIIKSLENVKIVDSIKKISQAKLQLWKDDTEKVKSDSEIEEAPIEKIVKDNVNTQNFYQTPKTENNKQKTESDSYRDTPEIEIVELSSDDNQNQKTQATLIKAKGYEKGCDDFDHVRYKVMKSELFKNSMIANYRKEAQFDGLLQYLQDYSFQELLTNNNIVIIEPVRTKVEPAPKKINNTDPYKIHPSQLKKNECLSQTEKTKNAIRRHFFYHPIRVNKEIIEEELPNPDTVKKVRNLFEDTLKMKSPMTQDPPLVEENVGLTRRSTSYRNLTEEVKSNKSVGRKKIVRQLTIDTNFGHKKWDNASLSSGVSSGDLSSNNDYEADALSPYSNKNIKDNAYSSSEEYLCDSANQDFCCESQYVSPDILKKIRECGTSVTYYGGKVLNSKMGSNVSPMTKAIMDEIKSLQRNCSTNCYSCQTKCKGEKCACLIADKHRQNLAEKESQRAIESENISTPEKQLRTDHFPGFKFKLVKSNSCSSRLELTGTDDNKTLKRFRRQNSKDDPPLVHDEENSVKNKICRLESYSKGQIKTPIKIKNNDEKTKYQSEQSKNTELKIKDSVNNENKSSTDQETDSQKDQIQDIASGDNHSFEKKFYYVNNNLEYNKVDTVGKFGEMVFEEFEVLENCYDSLNSNKSLK